MLCLVIVTLLSYSGLLQFDIGQSAQLVCPGVKTSNGMITCTSRLTVVSREAKKKQHACASSGPRDHYSELFTQMAALKI